MANYIDIHAHIIPGVDDGPKTMEESLQMAERAYEEGVRLIIATPHYGAANPKYDHKEAEEALSLLRKNIKEKYDDLYLYMGNELWKGSSSIIEDLRNGKAKTMAGTNYILVEFSPADTFSTIQNDMLAYIRAGYRPILAHVERYEELYKEPDRIEELISQGVYIQVNARNFIRGRFDKRASWCRYLIKNDLVHFIASDCHNNRGRDPIMKTAVEKLAAITSRETVAKITRNNVINMLKNNYL